MIDEKKLIDDYMNNYLVKNDGTWNDAIDRAVELAKTAPKVGEWIPIRFRETTDEDGFDKEEHPILLECTLPDDNEEVLITTKLGYVLVDTFCNDGGAYFDCYDWDEITAWMPLPEPYMKEGAGNEE